MTDEELTKIEDHHHFAECALCLENKNALTQEVRRLQKARALDERLTAGQLIAKARTEAYERCAKICDDCSDTGDSAKFAAAAIRALKDTEL